MGRPEPTELGIFLSLGWQALIKPNWSGSGEAVSLEGQPCKKDRVLWAYVRMAPFALPLPQAGRKSLSNLCSENLGEFPKVKLTTVMGLPVEGPKGVLSVSQACLHCLQQLLNYPSSAVSAASALVCWRALCLPPWVSFSGCCLSYDLSSLMNLNRCSI